ISFGTRMCAFIAQIETIEEEIVTPFKTVEVFLSVYPTAFVNSGITPEQLGVESLLEHECVPL
ncbi:hypothetical protein TNIN_142931, partial [Trichonephila inaurata madagascariensis]